MSRFYPTLAPNTGRGQGLISADTGTRAVRVEYSSLKIVTQPADEPVTVAEAKAYMRVSYSTEDSLITTMITAARRLAEAYTRRAIIEQEWLMVMDNVPQFREFELPWPLLISVEQILFTPSGGTPTVFDASNYIVDDASNPGRVALKKGASWPDNDLETIAGFTIRFKAGYGADGAEVQAAEPRFQEAIKMAVANWFEQRGQMEDMPRDLEKLPTVMTLLRPLINQSI